MRCWHRPTLKVIFFPINDSQKGMSVYALEVVKTVDYGYFYYGKDPELLTLAIQQNSVTLDDAGLAVASAIAAGQAEVFCPQSIAFTDGPAGDEGGVGVVRATGKDGLPACLVVGAMLGDWFGGLLAQNRIKAGWSVDRTRKLVITLGCLIMLPMLLAMSNPGAPVNAVLIMAVILFGFQTAIGNVQTLPSDLFGGKTVGTLAGLAGMAAKLSVAALTSLVPWLTAGGNYTPAFVIGAALATIAIASIWILCPVIEPLQPKKS